MPRKTSTSKYVGDCSPSGVMRQAVKVYKMSNAKNPAKTGNMAVDFAAGQIPLVKNWNRVLTSVKLDLLHNRHMKILANVKNRCFNFAN